MNLFKKRSKTNEGPSPKMVGVNPKNCSHLSYLNQAHRSYKSMFVFLIFGFICVCGLWILKACDKFPF